MSPEPSSFSRIRFHVEDEAWCTRHRMGAVNLEGDWHFPRLPATVVVFYLLPLGPDRILPLPCEVLRGSLNTGFLTGAGRGRFHSES